MPVLRMELGQVAPPRVDIQDSVYCCLGLFLHVLSFIFSLWNLCNCLGEEELHLGHVKLITLAQLGLFEGVNSLSKQTFCHHELAVGSVETSKN